MLKLTINFLSHDSFVYGQGFDPLLSNSGDEDEIFEGFLPSEVTCNLGYHLPLLSLLRLQLEMLLLLLFG